MDTSYFSYKVEGPMAVPFVLLACACCIAPIVFIVYLGIYAFNNPDNDAWIGKTSGNVDTSDFKLFNTQEDGSKGGATDLVDIHARFVSWFFWGFLQTCVIPFGACCLVLTGSMINAFLG